MTMIDLVRRPRILNTVAEPSTFVLRHEHITDVAAREALLDEAFDNGVDFRVDEGLATGDANDGGTAFFGCGEGLLGGRQITPPHRPNVF